MRIEEKSIAYAFISNGVQIYMTESEPFLATKLVCLDCGDSWYMSLTECFLCGAINPFLHLCKDCGNFQSITNSSNRCSCCESTNLISVCPNPDCVSNTDPIIKKEINENGGVFNKDSGFLIALQSCYTCGGRHHKYVTHPIYVRCLSKKTVLYNELEIKNPLSSSYLILKYKNTDQKWKYGIYFMDDVVNTNQELECLIENFSDIISVLFPTTPI